MNQGDPSKHRYRRDNAYTFINNGSGCGLFINRKKLLNPREGFMKDDMIIIEASLKVYVKQSTSMLRYVGN